MQIRSSKTRIVFLIATAGLALTVLLLFESDRQGRASSAGRNQARLDHVRFKEYEKHEYKGLPYRLLRPSSTEQKKRPLILMLHGMGGTGNDNESQLRVVNSALAEAALQTEHPCFVLAPQTRWPWLNPKTASEHFTRERIARLPAHWQPLYKRVAIPVRLGRGDLGTVIELVEKLIAELPIDPERIYVAGHSLGGFGTWTALHERPDLFSAAIVVAGGFAPAMDHEKITHIPVWCFHGTEDRVITVAFAREIFTKLESAGGNVKLTELSGLGHEAAPFAFAYRVEDAPAPDVTRVSGKHCDSTSDIWKWLFAQRRSDRNSAAIPAGD